MAFHVACPITCKRICYCSLGFPPKLRSENGRNEFLDQIAFVEEFLKDPWLLRVCEGSTVQIAVPKVVPPAITAVDGGDFAGDGEDLASAKIKRVAMQRKAAVASMKAEDFARRFESGSSVDTPKDSAAVDQSQSNVNVMCRLCFSGENEGSERARRMLPCRSCGKKYHRSCLKVWSQHRDLFHWSSWTCPSCRTCEICRRTGEVNKFKFCKRCDGAVHCYCMQPPHKNVSSGPYLCPKHTKCHSCESKVPGNGLSLRWFLGYTCCDACGRLFTKGNYCPACLKVYRDSESTPMVCCDVCQRWVHCQCDGISDERYMQFQIDGNLPYTCPTCRGECYQVRDLEDAVRELWRRRDEADQDLIASLRAAAGLPTEEEFFSIWPFSDDDDDIDGPSVRGVFGRAKLSYKSEADFLLKKTKECVKKSSSKKHVKKKGLQFPMDSTTAANYEEHHDAPFDASHQADSISPSITGSISPAVRMCSVNELGGLKDKFIDEVVVNSEDRKPSVLHFKSKINDNGTISSKDVGKAVSKPQTKGAKLVIHLGGRNKTITDPPMSDSSSYQREQAFMLNGSEAGSENRIGDYAVHKFDGSANCDDGYRVDGTHEMKGLKPRECTRIKLSKGKSQASGINAESGTSTGLSSPESSAPSISVRRSNDGGAAAVGLRKSGSKVETMSLQKHPEHKPDKSGDNFKSGKRASLASDTLAEDSRPLLRFKFKTPFPGSWPLSGEEERGAAKGQRSKRKRPSSLVEKTRQQEPKDVLEFHDKDVRNEIMDANWVLKKLGRDAIGKRVEVHQPSDNSWHKGVVSDVVEETFMLSIGLDDGRSKTFELGKQGIRLVPQKDKRLK